MKKHSLVLIFLSGIVYFGNAQTASPVLSPPKQGAFKNINANEHFFETVIFNENKVKILREANSMPAKKDTYFKGTYVIGKDFPAWFYITLNSGEKVNPKQATLCGYFAGDTLHLANMILGQADWERQYIFIPTNMDMLDIMTK